MLVLLCLQTTIYLSPVSGCSGRDLGGFKDYDICIRTDKHGQSIYGPSVTPLETPGRDGVHHVSLVALGGS